MSDGPRRVPAKRRRHSLGVLYRRLVLGGFLAVFGSWLLAALRLNLVREVLALNRYETACFILDFAGFGLAVFGLLTVVSILREFKARLDRIEALGERDW
ncbi:MAG: hypothetical protein AB1641_21105 [Thermodesulfobacteriota bacterium]